jgi:hypothetical protein
MDAARVDPDDLFKPIIGGVESAQSGWLVFWCGPGRRHVVTKRTGDLADAEQPDGVGSSGSARRSMLRASGVSSSRPSDGLRCTAATTTLSVVWTTAASASRRAGTAADGKPVTSKRKRPACCRRNAEATLARVGIGPTAWLPRGKGAGDAAGCGRGRLRVHCAWHRAQTREAGVPAERVHFLPNPVDMTLPASRRAERRRLRAEWATACSAVWSRACIGVRDSRHAAGRRVCGTYRRRRARNARGVERARVVGTSGGGDGVRHCCLSLVPICPGMHGSGPSSRALSPSNACGR